MTPLRNPGSREDIPAFRLENIHSSLKGDFQRPKLGIWLWILLIFITVTALVITGKDDSEKSSSPSEDQSWVPPGTEKQPDQVPMIIDSSTPKKPVSSKSEPAPAPVKKGYVRLATVQFWSEFGKPVKNRKRLEPIIRATAGYGARIICLPEACIPGYADVSNQMMWTAGKITDDNHDHVRKVAETRDGESLKFFAALAKELGIYLTVPLIESDGGRYYSSAFLVGPSGKVVLHARRRYVADDSDKDWVTPGELPIKTVNTPYGRIGLLLRYDSFRRSLLKELAAQKADIVLNPTTLLGENLEDLLDSKKLFRLIVKSRLTMVIANWTEKFTPWWHGFGMSRIICSDGRITKAKKNIGNYVALLDLPIRAGKNTNHNREQ